MAKGDRSAVDVGDLVLQAEPAHAADGLGGEGLVDLDEPDVGDGKAEPLEQLPGGRHRAVPHHPGIDAGRRRAHPPGHGLEAQRTGLLPVHQQKRRGAVVDAAGITGRHRAALTERRRQPGQLLHRGIQGEAAVFPAAARVLVRIDDDGSTLSPGRLDGDDLFGETAGVHGGHRPAVAFQGEGVLLLAADLHFGGDVLRGLAQADNGIDGVQPGIGIAPAHRGVVDLGMTEGGHPVRLRHAPRRAAHGFDAAADEHVPLAGDDRLGRLVDRLQGRGTVAVHGDARHLHREAGEQHGHAGHVPVVLAGLVAAAGVDVVQRRRVDPGARHQRLVNRRQQVVRADAGQPAPVFADGAAHTVDNDDFPHYPPSSRPGAAHRCAGTALFRAGAGGLSTSVAGPGRRVPGRPPAPPGCPGARP